MQVEMFEISRIKPYARNPRKNAAAVEAVARSIEKFGFRQPIVITRGGEIVVGHTRYLAAIQLGLTKVPVHFVDDLTPAQIQAYRIADNRLNEIADWDLDLLADELKELDELDFDLGLLGFPEKELNQLLQEGIKPGLDDPDAIPDPPDEPLTRRGDLYVMGDHRLLCGDSASSEDVDRLLGGQPVHLINTDPPYNVRVEPRSNNAMAAGLSSFGHAHHQQFDRTRRGGAIKSTHSKLRPKDRPLENDFISEEKFDQLLRYWFGNIARVLAPGRSFFIWGGYANCGNYPPVLKDCDLYFSQAIIWHKQHPVLTRKNFMGDHEWCFYGWRKGAGHQFFGPNNATDVWTVKKVNPSAMIHLTEKPVELAIRAIQYSSRAGENVLDLFGGSGSTMIAAQQTGRRAFLMEIDPLYCDVIVDRWERFTGQTAERQSIEYQGGQGSG